MRVAIVIPTYNGKHLLEQNLPQVLASLRPADQLIIVDDASSDGSVVWMRDFFSLRQSSRSDDFICYSSIYKNREIKVLVNQSNMRFASSCNRGVESANGEVVVLLNNDVVPKANFLDSLIHHFSDRNVFAVGCKEIATHQNNREFGRSELSFERGFFVHRRASDQNKSETAWVAGGSGAFRKSLWKEIGGFDLRYYPAYWEDIDVSFGAKRRGWKVLFEPQSIVYHNHESTNASVFGKRQVEIMGFKNQILFTWKNSNFIQLMQHLLWLPYHLTFTTYRSKGEFLLGFLQAVFDL